MPACSSAAAASPAGVPRDASGCARAGACGCRGFARGRVLAISGVAPALALAVAAASPAGASRDFWAVSQEMGVDFAKGPGLLGGFWRELFAVGFSDLGKRRRGVAFRADSPCETAQKSQAGFACVRSCTSWRVFRSRSVLGARIAIAEPRVLMSRA